MAGALAGQVAIVTGAGWNVGRGIAEAFAAAGARVLLASRRRELLEATAKAISSAGGEALVQVTDVTDAQQVEALVSKALDAFGRLDCFAAIAGGGCQYQPIEAIEPEDWERTLRLNLSSTFYCARAAVPVFRSQGSGVLITCSGGGGFHPVLGENMLAYACAKAAVCRLTDQLTAELWETPIRVNCLDPGLVWDEPTRNEIAAEEAKSGKPDPMRERNRSPEAAGELAVWLASAASEPIRGRLVSVYDDWWRDPAQVLAVDQSISRYRLRRDDL